MYGIDPKTALLVALCGFTIFYLVVMARRLMRHDPATEPVAPTAALVGIGFVSNFFDTLGIGSFATTTAMFRKWKLVPDEHIPGTLNVGHTLPTIAQAFIFTKLVPVDAWTLTLMIVAAVVGSFLGAGIVAKWSRHNIRVGMGWALIVAALLMLMAFASNVGPNFGASFEGSPLIYPVKLLRGLAAILQPLTHVMPKGGTLLALAGVSLLIGLVGNFILGALMSLGIGLYGPCMILIYFLGMDPKAAFPIMMGSCAFLMPVASARFIRTGALNMRATVGMAIGGVPAVLLAAFAVKSMPLDAVRVLVVIVVLYTAYGLLSAAHRERTRA